MRIAYKNDFDYVLFVGRVRGEAGNSSSSNNREANNSNTVVSGISNSNNGGPIGLGGLFSSGMPKLKPTRLRPTSGEKDSNNVNNTSFNQVATPSIKRGPPPVPPPVTQKPQVFGQVKILKSTILYVHNTS